MDKIKLIEITARLMESPKGILAIDESLLTCGKRFETLGVPNTEEKRRDYRELLVTAPDIEKYISGYIFFDETIKQFTKEKRTFTSILQTKGVNIGIKVDQGLTDLSLHPGEKITQGLDGLSERLKEYKNMGATFAKWRAVYTIGENTPSEDCMRENARVLGKYAALCQEFSIVPIIEPEVLIDGDHNIEKCYEVTSKNFDIIFAEMWKLGVFIPGVILKTSMILPGKDAAEKASPEKIAEATLRCLKAHVPAGIGGIVFLSGGQADEDATLNLNAMHQGEPLPWPLTFSYGRAIQNPALQSWAKNPEDINSAQELLVQMARNNSLASIGEYKK
ncbi:fructose-bisphosphate aldolase [Candidatus Nomurabacteria bacterium RIFCSPHIGHO2_01_FULL_43_16]|nr:MAG: fructose-bisphosphate aldolase [Candidatus Nomurabacteria bacterium RIFCSPHIGHO2_01_FULL_43_16]OGI97511.1 MAG: fructose-bisphosphate aldolase [Candidatus Nomurabacteria bacterium RIFCSPLOWO2_01_FULL_43_15]